MLPSSPQITHFRRIHLQAVLYGTFSAELIDETKIGSSVARQRYWMGTGRGCTVLPEEALCSGASQHRARGGGPLTPKGGYLPQHWKQPRVWALPLPYPGRLLFAKRPRSGQRDRVGKKGEKGMFTTLNDESTRLSVPLNIPT